MNYKQILDDIQRQREVTGCTGYGAFIRDSPSPRAAGGYVSLVEIQLVLQASPTPIPMDLPEWLASNRKVPSKVTDAIENIRLQVPYSELDLWTTKEILRLAHEWEANGYKS